MFGGAVFWLSLSIPVGILSALRPRSIMDRVSMTFVLIGISAHPVWIGLILSYVFGYRLHLTPIAGYCNFFPGTVGAQCSGPVNWAYHLILPWITFMILFAALYVRLVRANVMETMSEDYVRTARAKGASQSRVMVQHVLRNSMLPVVTILGMDLGLALGGAIFTESIFNLPGLGHEVINAYNFNDLPMITGIVDLRDHLRDRLQLHRRRELRLPRPESPTAADACRTRGQRPHDTFPHRRRCRQGRDGRQLLGRTRGRRWASSASPVRGRASRSSPSWASSTPARPT